MSLTKRALFASAGSAAVLVAGCSIFTNPLSPTLIQDGQLIVTGLQTLGVLVTPLSAAAAVIVNLAASAVQTALTDLQANTVTPAAFAKTVDDEITLVATPLEADFKANASIQAGVIAIKGMIQVVGDDLTPVTPTPVPATAGPTDHRTKLKTWIAAHK